MEKDKSDSLGCLEILLMVVFFCGIPYSFTLFIPLLIIGFIIYLYNVIVGKNKQKDSNTIINENNKTEKSDSNILNPIPIECKNAGLNISNQNPIIKWKDEYGVEYSENCQVLEYYSPNLDLMKYKVIEGCKIIKSYSFNKELDVDYSECVDVFAYGNNLETIILPDTIEIIEDDAFWGCEHLQRIVIPKGMIDYFIDICPSMKDYFIEQDNTSYSENRICE